jgi:hypothetical protein
MEVGFQNDTLVVQTRDGLDDILVEALVFLDYDGTLYRAPIGSTTDGLSTPKIVRIIPGYDATGDDWWSGVLHDSGYRDFLQVSTGVWIKANLTQKQCDHLIYSAMKSQGVGFLRRHIIFYALRLFGGFAFKGDRKASSTRAPEVHPTTPA